MAYAARDAQVSIALFLHLLGLLSEASPASSSGSSYSELAARCQGLVDVPFRGRGDGDDRAADGERRRRTRKPPTTESPESGDQQVPDPRRNNKRKPLGVGYSARWECTVKAKKHFSYNQLFMVCKKFQKAAECKFKMLNSSSTHFINVSTC